MTFVVVWTTYSFGSLKPPDWVSSHMLSRRFAGKLSQYRLWYSPFPAAIKRLLLASSDSPAVVVFQCALEPGR